MDTICRRLDSRVRYDKNTESPYGHIKRQSALDMLKAAWMQEVYSPLIDQKQGITGYN